MNTPSDADTPLETFCPTCGTSVEVASSDEGTNYYRPLDATRATPGYGEKAAREFIESITAFRTVDAELVNAVLGELSESPLPGARYAYEVVKRRFAAALASQPATASIDVELCPDCEGTGYVRHSGDLHFRAVP